MATDVLLQSPPGRGILAALTCPCCYDLLKNAVTLPCTHHVCQRCFLALCNGSEQFFCPNNQCGQLVQAGTCILNPLVQSFIEFLELLMSTPKPAQQHGFGTPNLTVKRSAVGPPVAHGATYPFKVQFNLPLQGMYQNSSPATSVGENSACNSPESIGVSVGGDPPPSVAYKYEKDTTVGAGPTTAACAVGGLSYHDRTVLTPHQRQYIRYVVVTDESGSDFTVGIKHVLHTVGSHKLLQLLEKNIGSEYKKRVSQRVCLSVIQGTPCGLKQDCPLIHVTQEGWQERRPSMPRTRAEAAAAAIAMGVAFDALKPHLPSGFSDLGPAVAS